MDKLSTSSNFMKPVIPSVEEYEIIAKPSKQEEDHWVGAPSAFRDSNGIIWLTYRERDPDERGTEMRIAKSENGFDFETVKIIRKEDLGAKSLERSALIEDPKSGKYKLYLSPDPDYSAADPQALGWHIIKLNDVKNPKDFDPDTAKIILSPKGTDGEIGPVKDPYVMTVGWVYYMFYTAKDGGGEQAHLAISTNGEDWQRKTELNPIIGRNGWHNFHTRVACVLPKEEGFIVYYEGTNRLWYQPMYNIQTGIASSQDLKKFFDVTQTEPILCSPTPSGNTSSKGYQTLRYLDYIFKEESMLFYYEAANKNGSFELRVTESRF